MRRCWTALVYFVWPAGVFAQATDFSAARQLIRDGMAKDSVPAVAVAIARGDSILWVEGFGFANRETRVPATIHTPFYLASVTKTITATAAMVLRERGLIDLDRPANTYLAGSRITSPAWDTQGATLRRLANHTSGLTTFDLGCSTECEQLPSHDEIIRNYGVLMEPPGEHFDYSNIGYLVLGDAIASAAHADLATILRDNVFRPLGMMDASLGIDPRLASQTAVQYSWTRGPLQGRALMSGGSSVYASAYDVALFGMLHAKGRVFGAETILSNAAIDTMQYATVSAGGDSQYGLGWWVEADRYGYRSVLAQGGTDASATWLRIIPSEHITAVVLANKGVAFPSDVVDAMIAALLPRYAEGMAAQRARALTTAATKAPVPPPSRLDSAFVGTWRGIARAERGDVPIEIMATDSGTLRASVGLRPSERTGTVSFSGGTLRLRLNGDLEIPDSTGARRLAFYLRPRNGALNGTVTTNPSVSSHLDGRVSYWVELRKVR